ncbi:tetratricopeptide repeat protein [Flavobacteriaceae bacterium]|nr:tetratricopeptide repeat protein [Flavobacteriaceae bacterium]MDC1539958.1 tetratricopeptide repeat protein [Flavobacteriaceae bacterium]
MATYKKRGGKPSTKTEKETSIEDGSTTAEVFNTLDESASRTEEWVIKNQKYIFIIVGLAAALVLGYLVFDKFVQEPKQSIATNDMFQSQQYFDQAVNGASKDSLFTLALNGADGKYGFLDIADVYSGTDAGNLANYYAGMAYLNMKDYSNAITYLNAFSSDDDVLGPIAKGGIGDAFVQLEQLEDAFDYYVQASQLQTNDYTTPMYLLKAGMIGLKLENYSKALAFFNQIKSEFPESTEAKDIGVFIGKAEASIN